MAQDFSFQMQGVPQQWQDWMLWLTPALDVRNSWRLPIVCLGLLFAKGRRTVTSWLHAQCITTDYADYYYFLGSLGRKIEPVATRLLALVIVRLPLGERLLLAIDDSPTRRYGPNVEGAGLHRNPTSGPDDHKWVYGHIWVTLALVVRHPLWRTIALPLRALLYVKAKDLPKLGSRCDWQFRTKLELAVALVQWAEKRLRPLGKPVWVVCDGAYAYRSLLKPMKSQGVTVVSRLRKDAGLRSLPRPGGPRGRGPRRKYGTEQISLAQRAAHRQGWKKIELLLYGEKTVTKTYKTFVATWPPAGGVIRVVLVKEQNGWESMFCTDPEASVAAILECFADRSSIEQGFHDLKEVWGAGQQQVRHVFTNIACWHLSLWMHTLVEVWAWDQPAELLRDRSGSPWDNANRRPSHADRRKALCRQCLKHEISALQAQHLIHPNLKNFLNALTQLAT